MFLTLEEKINFLKTLPEYAKGRISQINSKIGNSNNLQLHIIMQIKIAMNEYLKSLIAIIEMKNILVANVIFRSFVEAFINISYIMQTDNPKRAIAYFFDDYKVKERNISYIKKVIINNPDKIDAPELSTIKKCNEQLEKIKDEKNTILNNLKNDYETEMTSEDLKIPSLEIRANLSNLGGIYDLVYRYLCGITHLSASGLKIFIRYENGKYFFEDINFEEEANRILIISYDYYLLSLENFLKKFNLYVEQDFKIMEDISKKMKD